MTLLRYSPLRVLGLSALLLVLGSPGRGEAQAPQDQLWDAARSGDTLALSRALAAGAQIDALDTRRSPNGRRALNWAAIGNQPGAIQFLVAHGAKLDAGNLTGFTPLHHSAENGSLEAAKVLVELGADRTAKNNAGETAAEVARRTSHPDVGVAIEAGTKAP